MKSWQRYAGLFLLGVAGVVIYQSLFILRLTDAGQPGSGFLPFGLGVLLAILSVLLILNHLGPDPKAVPFLGESWLRPILALAIMVAFTAGLPWIGAVAGVLLLVVIWLLVIEGKPIWTAVVTGVATGAVVYLLFEVALQAPFPKGVIFGG